MTHMSDARSTSTPRAGAAVTPHIRVLIAEDEANLGMILEQFMSARGFAVTMVRNGRDALEQLRSAFYDVALLDVVMPEVDGLEVLRQLRTTPLPPEIIIITGNSGIETAMAAMKLGAYDFLAKPYRMAEIEALVRRAFEKRLLHRTNRALRAQLDRLETEPTFETHFAPLRAVRALVEEVALTDVPVLVQGEAGTGKRAMARTLHARSSRAAAPFVDVSCHGNHSEFLRALVGAPDNASLTGALDLASSGTVYLDEVAELSRESQRWLAHALASGTYTSRGNANVSWTARVIVGSTKTPAALEQAVDAELLHLLTAARIELPPLRVRAVDIPMLAERLLGRLAPGRAVTIASDALAQLEKYDWPGNISELKLVLQRALLLSRDSVLDAASLGFAEVGPRESTTGDSLRLDHLERAHIARVLESTRWHQGNAAELLGISPKTLYRKIREYGFRRPAGRTT